MRSRNHLARAPAHHAAQKRLFALSKAAAARQHLEAAGRRYGGEKVDHATQRIGTIQSRSRAMQHFDRAHGLQGNRQIQIVMRSLRVVEAQPVQQDQRLLER